jgi:Tyrosine phosphatase family
VRKECANPVEREFAVGRRFRLGLSVLIALGLALGCFWEEFAAKRVAVVVAGKVWRGAWQRPGSLRRIIDREKIKTIVTLTAMNTDDPKYVGQSRVVLDSGVDWVIVPMRGSRATLDQMAEAADLLADPARQPVFFHCVAGHHRTGLVHAAYRIRHEGWTASRAWDELMTLPWARPTADGADRRLIEAFADWQRRQARQTAGKEPPDAVSDISQTDRATLVDHPDRGVSLPRNSL